MEKVIAAYIRVSTEQQVEKNSIDNQKDAITRELVTIRGYNPDSIVFYIDGGYSAGSMNRPQFKLLIKTIKKEKVSCVCVYDLARLSRDVPDVYYLMDLLAAYNIEFINTVFDVNINSSDGRMQLGMISVFHQWERETDIRRTKDCMIFCATKKKQHIFGRAPYGYIKDENKCLVICPDEAKLIKACYSMAERKYTKFDIMNYMNEHTKNKKIWNSKSISRLLKNPIYYGSLINTLVHVDNFCEPIISKEDFNTVSKIVFRKSRRTKYTYLFKNKVFCSDCDCLCRVEPTVKKKTIYFYYVCRICKKRINEKNIIIAIEPVANKKVHSLYLSRITNCTFEINRILSLKEVTFNKLTRGLIDHETYSDIITAAKKKEVTLIEKHALLEREKNQMFFSINIEQKRKIVNSLIERIKVSFKNKQIVVNEKNK